jgi:hypothetical protein
METLQQTSLNLRNAAIQNITDYCNKNNCPEQFNEIKKELILQAEKDNNELIPIEFYRKFYNLSIEFLK